MRRTDRVAKLNAGTTDVSRANRLRILQYLRDDQTHTRIEVARAMKMSPATVNRLSRLMIELGLIEEVGAEDVKSGRPGQLIQFNPEAKKVLAVTLCESGSSIDLAEVNLDGNLSRRESLPAGDSWRESLIAAVEARIANRGAGDPLWAIGVALPSTMGQSIRREVSEQLAARFHLPAFVEQDCNALALAEYYLDDLDRFSSMVLVEVDGRQVGAGLIIEGEIWRGFGSAAGDLDQIRGADGRSLVDRVVAATAAIPRQPVTAETLRELADECALHLGNLCSVLAPDCLMLAGQLARWSEILIPELQTRLGARLEQPPLIRAARLGGDGKLIGAGLSAMRSCGGVGSLF